MLPTNVWYGIPSLRASVRSSASTALSRRMFTGTLAAPGSILAFPDRFLSFFRSYSLFIGLRLLGCRLPSRNDSDRLAPVFFTEDYEQNPLFPRRPKRFASREGSGGPSGVFTDGMRRPLPPT